MDTECFSRPVGEYRPKFPSTIKYKLINTINFYHLLWMKKGNLHTLVSKSIYQPGPFFFFEFRSIIHDADINFNRSLLSNPMSSIFDVSLSFFGFIESLVLEFLFTWNNFEVDIKVTKSLLYGDIFVFAVELKKIE